MAALKIDSGDFPSAEGAQGGDLDRVVSKWSRKINGGFTEGAEWLLRAIEEVDRLELWKVFWRGFYKTREEFISAKVLHDFKVVESTIPAILERLKAGEAVNLERTNGERVEFIPPLRPHGGDRRSDQHNKNENVMLIERQGNASEYRIAKLKRDAPEFAERLQAGEFKTVREAERAAGFAVPPKLTALEKVLRAFDRLSIDDKIEFCKRMLQAYRRNAMTHPADFPPHEFGSVCTAVVPGVPSPRHGRNGIELSGCSQQPNGP